MTQPAHLAWLGTGRLGTALAHQLLEAALPERTITVWNRTPAKCERLVRSGAHQAQTLAELASADVVFVCVTTSEDLLDVLFSEGGLLSTDTRPSIVVDCSTVSEEASAEARARLAVEGVAFLAAPVSGNPSMIAERSAAIAVSGPHDSFETVRADLEAMAPTVVYTGTGEESRLVKICHNLLLGVITQGLAEVTVLAEKAGVPPGDFLAFINGSVLGSPFIAHKGRAIHQGDFEPTFTAVNLRKDYDLGMGAARRHEAPMPLTSSTYQLIQSTIGNGFGNLDYVALYLLQAASAGTERKPE